MQIPKVKINHSQANKIAEVIKNLPKEEQALNFYSFKKGDKEIVASDMYPSLNHPQTTNFFSFACLHQFAFWLGDSDGYEKPLVGLIKGKESKGSDLLWKALINALNKNKNVFEPKHLAVLDSNELRNEIFVDDKDTIHFQDFNKRLEITNAYGNWFLENKTNPQELVTKSNDTDKPLQAYLDQLNKVPGFSQDPLQKKALLLAMALANRPEAYLDVKDPESWNPIIDYHLMRVALRLGLVELDESEREINKARKWTTGESEKLIRLAVYEVMQEIIEKSGRPMSLLDHTLWLARRYCPEMQEPDCPKCIFTTACKKDTELFQPVLRTIDY